MKTLFLLIIFSLTSCGYSARNTEVIGQIKKIENKTPLICPDMVNVDLSLGVMRNGTGSMSTQDKWFYLPDSKMNLLETLRKAQDTGKLVKIFYDEKRFAICQHISQIVSVEIIEE